MAFCYHKLWIPVDIGCSCLWICTNRVIKSSQWCSRSLGQRSFKRFNWCIPSIVCVLPEGAGHSKVKDSFVHFFFAVVVEVGKQDTATLSSRDSPTTLFCLCTFFLKYYFCIPYVYYPAFKALHIMCVLPNCVRKRSALNFVLRTYLNKPKLVQWFTLPTQVVSSKHAIGGKKNGNFIKFIAFQSS